MFTVLLLLLSAALVFSGYSAYKEDKRQGIALRQREVRIAFAPVIQNLGLVSAHPKRVCPDCGSGYCSTMVEK